MRTEPKQGYVTNSYWATFNYLATWLLRVLDNRCTPFTTTYRIQDIVIHVAIISTRNQTVSSGPYVNAVICMIGWWIKNNTIDIFSRKSMALQDICDNIVRPDSSRIINKNINSTASDWHWRELSEFLVGYIIKSAPAKSAISTTDHVTFV